MKRRILVRLDSAPSGRGALETAATLAALLDAELVGLYIEDADLLSLAALPFAHEIGLASGKRRALNVPAMERQLGAVAERARRALEQIAARGPLRWTFRTARGSMPAALFAAMLAEQASAGNDLVITHAAGLEWSALTLAERPAVFVIHNGAPRRMTLVAPCSPALDPAVLASTVCTLARGSVSGVDLIGLCDDPVQGEAWRSALRAQLAAHGCENQVRMLLAASPQALASLLQHHR